MGPLWLGQGTVPHCTVSDLLSTDELVSSPGTLLGAKETGSDYKHNVTVAAIHTFSGSNSSNSG